MRPSKQHETGQFDLLRSRLDQIIDMEHALVRLSREIAWGWIDDEVAPLFSDEGRPGLPSRFAVGLLLLKRIYNLSDEQPSSPFGHMKNDGHLGRNYFKGRGGDAANAVLIGHRPQLPPDPRLAEDALASMAERHPADLHPSIQRKFGF